MRAGRISWLVAGLSAVALLGACDQIKDKAAKLGELFDKSAKQIQGEAADASPDLLTAAPVNARALAGEKEAAQPLPEVTLEDALRDRSFFVVGSIIAKPKVELSEPSVEPASFDMAAATPDAAAPATTAAPAAGAPAPTPGSAPASAGKAQPESATISPVSPAPPPPPAPAAAPAPGQAPAAPNRDLAVRPNFKLAMPRGLSRDDLGANSRELERAVRERGLRITHEQLEEARRGAEMALRPPSPDAQRIGDEIARKYTIAGQQLPRELLMRRKLNLDRALPARDRAFKHLERLGLSGVVTPEEGGTMRITIGVSPTKLPPGVLELKSVKGSIRTMFAEAKDAAPPKTCAGATTIASFKNDPVLATDCVVKSMKDSGDYEYVEKDFIFTNQMIRKPKPKPGQPGAAPAATNASAKTVPNNPLWTLQWDFMDNGSAKGQSLGGASFSDFWTRAKLTGSRSVTVAIVDTGIDMKHPDIAKSANIAPGFDMVSNPAMAGDGDGRDADPTDPGDKCDPNDPTAEDSWHGTHVAGTIGAAATNKGVGVAAGVWDVTIVPVRALGRCGGQLSDINDGIRWAAGLVPARDSAGNEVWNKHPADIINLSIGLFEPCPASMQSAINDAVAHGAVVVAAAGNSRIDAKYFAPGGCDNVISVAAGDARGVLTPYSNFGPKVSIMAPGGDMTRDDDGDGRPDGILSTKRSSNCNDPVTKSKVAECFYSYESGTSMAAPHVSAALALLKAKFPAAVPSELKSRLLAAATPRTPLQCSGKCASYPGSEPIPGQDGMCFRPCGGEMLNLAKAALQ